MNIEKLDEYLTRLNKVISSFEIEIEKLLKERDKAIEDKNLAELAQQFGSPFDPTGVKRGTEISQLRDTIDKLEQKYKKDITISDNLYKWLNLERERLLKESRHLAIVRSNRIARGESDSSTWPEFLDGQAEGLRQVILYIDNLSREDTK